MQKQEVQKHFLALMARPGDYSFISIAELDLADRLSYDTLQDIDTWTIKWSKEEIVDSIKRANIVSSKYLEGTLVIQDNQKHNPLPVIDKTFYDNFNVEEFFHKAVHDKKLANKIVNKYSSIDLDNSRLFKDALENNDIKLALDIMFSLPYLSIRKLIIYFINILSIEKEKEKNKELKRDKNN